MRNVIYNFRNSQKFQLERKRTFFFLSGFPFTDTDDSQDSKGREGTFWDLFLFDSTTSTRSRTFRHLFATLHVRWLSNIFNRPLLFTWLLLDEICHLIELPFDWLMMWCWILFVYLMIWFSVFVTAICHGKPVDLNSHRLSPLYYKQTD